MLRFRNCGLRRAGPRCGRTRRVKTNVSFIDGEYGGREGTAPHEPSCRERRLRENAMKLARQAEHVSETHSTRVCSVSADGESISLANGSSWMIVGLNSYLSRNWKVGDEVAPGYDEIHHYRTNTRLPAHLASRA